MAKISRRTKIIAAFIIVIGVGYGIAQFIQAESNGIPAQFTAARTQGAIIAQTIVSTSNSSTATLAQISKYDQEGNYTDALASTTALIAQSADLRTQAVDLSNQVSQMTQSLSGINSDAARQAALEAISSRLALINELISYSNDLDKLLTTLQARFSGTPESNATVQAIVDQINTDVNAINNFNAQATQAMQQFDAIEAGK
jgi:DNA repair ATPase RecN